MGAEEVRALLTYLAAERDVAASTLNQAFSALVFLYKDPRAEEAVAASMAARWRHVWTRACCSAR
jgi:uncharacterized protein YqiB (DUF1249 family)